MIPSNSMLRFTPLPFVAAFGLCAMYALVGLLYLGNEVEEVLGRSRLELTALGKVKVDQLRDWRDERIADARIVQGNAHIVRELQLMIASRVMKHSAKAAMSWRTALLATGHYSSVQVVTVAGDPVKRNDDVQVEKHLDPGVLRTAVRSRSIVFDELRQYPDGTLRLHIYVPMLLPRGNPIAVVILEVDPETELFRLTDVSPLPMHSSELVLFRAEGDSIVFLNATSRQFLLPGSTRIPINTPALPASWALRGNEGLVDGVDYRGKKIVTYVSRIPGSSWYLVAKIDRDEILEEARSHDVPVLIAVFLGSLLTVGTVIFIQGVNRRKFAEEALQHQLSVSALRRHYADLTRYANDIIVLSDREDRIVEANQLAESVYEYSAEELLGRPVASLNADGLSREYDESMSLLRIKGHERYETTHRSKHGRSIPVEVSARLFTIEDRTYCQRIIRDISERKAFERELLTLNRVYRVLSSMNHAVIRKATEFDLLQAACQIGVAEAGYASVWIGQIVPGVGRIEPLCSSGVTDPEFHAMTDPFGGDSKIAQSAREGAAIVRQIDGNGKNNGWEEAAFVKGIRSYACLPLSRAGDPWGVICCFSNETNFFQQQELQLLSDVSSNLSLALTGVVAIKERFAAAEALRESEERYRLVFQKSGEAILLTHPDSGEIVSANPAACRMFGYTEEELRSKGRSALVVDDDPRMAAALETRRLHGSFQGELTLRRADGSTFPVEMTSTNFISPDGKTTSSMNIRDISERRAVEDQMRSQLLELSRWHDLTLEREMRVLELKREVNDLLVASGRSVKYVHSEASQENGVQR